MTDRIAITLSDEQQKAVALHWIAKQHQVKDGYKEVLTALFDCGVFCKWSWATALTFAAKYCSKKWCSSKAYILLHIDHEWEEV